MKKVIIIIFTFIVCLISIFLIYGFVTPKEDDNKIISINNEIKENIVNNLEENILETSSEERKISYNATIILNKYYKKCNHTITSTVDVPYDMINMSIDDIEKNYQGWKIIEFSEDEVSLYKEFEGICNEHYLVGIEDGYITVYNLDEDNEKKLYEKTEIDVEYLTEEDKKELMHGITVIGYSSLNALLENYE